MRKIEVNGIEIVTNYGEASADLLCDGNYKKNYIMRTQTDIMQSEKEFLNELVNMGYKRIMIKRVSTSIRGYHDIIAYVR